MVVGYTGKDRIFHLPFVVELCWNCMDWRIHSRFFIASSIWEFSKLSRYICVVSRSECPRLSLIIAMFTPDLFRTVANVCRAT